MSLSYAEIEESVKKWWSTLKYERKCKSTNTVFKIVSGSSDSNQDQVRKLLAEEIAKVINQCLVTKSLNEMQVACNAINGCFDNFIHAVDAVRTSFFQVVSFINIGFDECQSQLLMKNNSKHLVLELLHSLSRILILVLKLKRTNASEKNMIGIENQEGDVKDVNLILCELSHKIGKFLIADEILIDTKNNLSMCGILIKEILLTDEKELVKFHKKFVSTIPSELYEENFKVDILKFLTSSAIINTWSVNIIDSEATYIYLKFFISLCENYSSETPIILNTSRTLLLLIKHEAFQNFVLNTKQEKVDSVTSHLLSCVFMLLEHPVACIRHSAKDFLCLLAANRLLQPVMTEAVFKLPFDKRSFFISLGALANEVGARILIEKHENLPEVLLSALKDPTIVSHVSLALECVILKDSLAEENFPMWCETWIVPLLVSLINVLPIVAADIDKLLDKSFKKYPDTIIYVTNKWASPSSGEELRYVITALKISCKQGFKIKENPNASLIGSFSNLESEKRLMNEELLKNCLHQRDDDIRLSAFSLLIEAHKSTKPYTEKDFRLIKYFLKYNLNNQQPSTRQKILGLIRKMLVRFSDSKGTFLKPTKKNLEKSKEKLKSLEDSQEKSKNLELYEHFLDSLVDFCFSNIFVGCNFNRLNTVLNILSLCFENIKDFSFKSSNTNFYWNKILIALDSSYEENKELAVLVSRNLDFSALTVNDPEEAVKLYRKAFSLCSHIEPPDVLTGAYLLLALTNFPSSKKVLSENFMEGEKVDNVLYFCIRILVEKLKEQLLLAKVDLMTAATCGPMYGTLFAIRLIFKNFSFSGYTVTNEDIIGKWSEILNELVEICFEMAPIVGCGVNGSSTGGHLPNDFQTDLEYLLFTDFSAGCRLTDSEKDESKTSILFKRIKENLMKKTELLKSQTKSTNCDFYETVRSLVCLQKETRVLIDKANYFGADNEEVKELKEVKVKLNEMLESLEKPKGIVDWPATAQVLLLCAWRSIKESSLFLGDFVTKLPIENLVDIGLLSNETVVKIGEELKILLCEVKHRGAFEHAYIGFTNLVNSLWKCPDKNLSNLPRKWLQEIIDQLTSPLKAQKIKLCSTRRSAGLPFLVQAIICSEITSVKSVTPTSLHTTMESLLEITENGVANNPEAKIHALNILGALFKHAQLGEHVASYVSRALIVAIRGSRAATWPERNSSNLLFSSLIIRIFGVSRSKDEISKKNRMTSRTFFQRYPELYDFLLSEMKYNYSDGALAIGFIPKPSLYLILLVLGRLHPPPTEDPDNIDLSEFLPFIKISHRNPIMKIRKLGARALVPLVPLDRFFYELDERFSLLSSNQNIRSNERHGILLQIKALLTESNFLQANLSKEKITWIEKTKWLLESFPQVVCTVLASYVKVLHILYKNFNPLIDEITQLVLGVEGPSTLLLLDPKQIRVLHPGVFLFLENFYFLKADILLHSSKCDEDLFELFKRMLTCSVSEVQSVPLRILRFALEDDVDEEEDYDFYGIGSSLKSLTIFSERSLLKVKLLSKPFIPNLLIEKINMCKSNTFESRVIHRLWLSVVSNLVMAGQIPLKDLSPCSSVLNINKVKEFLKAGQKELSTSAFICYAVYLMEELRAEKKVEDILELVDILEEFSHREADSRERAAVANVLKRYSSMVLEKAVIDDPNLLSIWMIPFRLLLDEDPLVRRIAGDFVQNIQKLNHEQSENSNTKDWYQLPLVSLKAQECLLDSYVRILGEKNILHLLVQLLVIAMSSIMNLDDVNPEHKFGVFEKGNPNPYFEGLAVAELMRQKLSNLHSTVDLKEILTANTDDRLAEFISKKVNLYSDEIPNSEKHKKLDLIYLKTWEKLEAFSLPRINFRV